MAAMLPRAAQRALMAVSLFSIAGIVAAQGLFVTNTPPAPAPPAAIATPAAPEASYASRLWLERDLVDEFIARIRAIDPANPDTGTAARLTEAEWRGRYPQSTLSTAQSAELLAAMLAAPPGILDLRPLVRATVEDALNADPDTRSLAIQGIEVDVLPANLDGRDGLDAVLGIRYPADAMTQGEIVYEEVIAALRGADGRFRLTPAVPELPVVPLNARAITLEQLDDVTRSGTDEAIVVVDDGALNQRLVVLGYRGGSMTDLAYPAGEIRFGDQLTWVETGAAAPKAIQARMFTTVDARWGCLETWPVEWAYSANRYVPVTIANATPTRQNSLACALAAGEPYFSRPPGEAIVAVAEALSSFSNDYASPAAARANLTLALLQAADGDPDQARSMAEFALNNAPLGSDTARQAAELLAALGTPGNTPLDICAAVVAAGGDHPVCDSDAMLGHVLGLLALNNATPLEDQLRALGLPIDGAQVLRRVGFADRQAFHFALAGTSWWGFVAQPDGGYHVEKLDLPWEAPQPPANVVPGRQLSPATEALLLTQGDAAALLAQVETLRRQEPGASLAPRAAYFEALAYDLVGQRREARPLFFRLWEAYPDTVWGQMAASQLEGR
jgi:hypothetical protein